VIELIREAIEMHLEAMRDSGEAVAEPSAFVEYVEVAA
jgi:predicted RNase H-like HicB family nuclease